MARGGGQGLRIDPVAVPPTAQRDPVYRLWDYAREHKMLIVLGCICGVIASIIMLSVGMMIKQMQMAMEDGQVRLITIYAASTLFVFLAKGVFHFGQVFLLSDAAERVAMRLRNQLYEHMQILPLGILDARKTGGLMSAIASDVPVVQQMLTTAIMEGVTAPVVVVGGISFMLYLNWRLALATLICLPLMGCAISAAGKRMRAASESIQKSLSTTSALATENLSAIRVVRSFGMEDREAQRFREESRHTYRANMRVVRINAGLKPVVELLGALSLAFILWFGGLEIHAGRLRLADVAPFLFVANQITVSIQQIGRFKQNLDRMHGAARRIFDLLDIAPDIVDAPNAAVLHDVRGHICFDNVRFAYPESEPILHGLSFEAQPGEVVALVGPSGSGKTTVANLIPRFYDINGGSISVDGIDVRDATVRSLRAQIGIVAQEPVLFSGTLYDNIIYGRPDASEEDVMAAARAANAHAFITQLPMGYNTVVGERGAKLSGGQKQRIAIARALLRDPKILILDEATSALDAESEALVQEALDKLMQGRTTIIIAHRLSTVRKANRILVLAQGAIQEQGTHNELMRLNGFYARLYDVGRGESAAAQLSGNEAHG